MANRIRTGDPRGFNKGRERSRVRQTPEGRWTYRPKRFENNNKVEDNSPKTLNNKKSDYINFDETLFFWLHDKIAESSLSVIKINIETLSFH